jgi:pyruvate/2-oxoglutarate/acetoin dehydrogenase E1 component
MLLLGGKEDLENNLTYLEHLRLAMEELAQNPQVIFLGQCVGYPGNALFKTVLNIDEARRIEMPVVEDLQMGISTGLALNGFIPVTVYPRFDFLILAANQLVNHLDKFSGMSGGTVSPKVIIRVCVGSTHPLHPGIQHCSDHTEAFSLLLKNTEVIRLADKEQIIPSYRKALNREDGKSTLLVELADLYNQ